MGWAGLGVSQPCCRVYWARAPAPAEGPAVLQAPCAGAGQAGHRCRAGVEARDTVCSHSVLAWVSLCFRIRGFLVTAVQPPVPAPAPAWYRPWNWLEAGSAGSWLAEYGCMTAVTISTHRQYQSIGHPARWTLTSPPAQHGLISTNTLASGVKYFRAFICVLW